MTNEEKILSLLGDMRGEITDMRGEMTGMRGEMTDMRGEITGMRGEMTDMRTHMQRTDERLDRIETDMSDLKTKVSNLGLVQDNVILPKLQGLAEGHGIIQDQIRRLSVIDQMQDDISVLKVAVKHLSQEVARLSSAG